MHIGNVNKKAENQNVEKRADYDARENLLALTVVAIDSGNMDLPDNTIFGAKSVENFLKGHTLILVEVINTAKVNKKQKDCRQTKGLIAVQKELS